MSEPKLEVGMIKCFFCGKEKGLVMNSLLTEEAANQVKEMHGHAIDFEPCDKCKKLMEQGIMLQSVRDGESGNNPYRTGRMVVITEEGLKDMCGENTEMYEQMTETRFAFIEDTMWKNIGLPMEGEK